MSKRRYNFLMNVEKTKFCRFAVRSFLFFLGILVLGSASLSEAVLIPADRLPLPGTWESAGVEGGIPNRTTICADVTQAPYNADKTGAVSASAAIQSAINNCPVDQV